MIYIHTYICVYIQICAYTYIISTEQMRTGPSRRSRPSRRSDRVWPQAAVSKLGRGAELRSKHREVPKFAIHDYYALSE